MPQDQIRLDLGGKGLDFTLEAMGSQGGILGVEQPGQICILKRSPGATWMLNHTQQA